MKRDSFWRKVNKERRRVKWSTALSATKTFLVTILFIFILTIILFAFTSMVVAIFDAIKAP